MFFVGQLSHILCVLLPMERIVQYLFLEICGFIMILIVPIRTSILGALLVATPRPTAFAALALYEDSAHPNTLGCRKG